MSEEKKLVKRLRMFKRFDEATIVAAVSTTTMKYGNMKAANDGMDRFYNICKEIDDISTENEHTKTTSTAKRTKEQVFKAFLDQFLKYLTIFEFRQDLDQFEIGIGNYLSFRKGMLRDFKIQLRGTYLVEIEKFQGKNIGWIYFLHTTQDLFRIKSIQHIAARTQTTGKREFKHWAILIEL